MHEVINAKSESNAFLRGPDQLLLRRHHQPGRDILRLVLTITRSRERSKPNLRSEGTGDENVLSGFQLLVTEEAILV